MRPETSERRAVPGSQAVVSRVLFAIQPGKGWQPTGRASEAHEAADIRMSDCPHAMPQPRIRSMLTPKTILVLLSIVMAAFAYVYQPLLPASVILLGASHFVP